MGRNDETNDEFEVALKDALDAIPDDTGQKVFVDVSCFTRFRLAAIVHEIFNAAMSRTNDLVVDFAYAVAKFEKPTSGTQPNTIVGPAHRAFAGWSQGGYSSTAAVLGLGYEQDQAMGAHHVFLSGLNVRAAPFMQNRSPVGLGPSSNTCPRCPPQREQCTSVRTMK